MKEKSERLLLAIGEVDEKYVKEAEGKMTTKAIIKVAAVATAVVALALYLFIPFGPVKSDLREYNSSPYFDLIEGIEDYRLSLVPQKYKNNFEKVSDNLKGFFRGFVKGNSGGSDGLNSPNFDNSIAGAPSHDAGSSYVEATDNQVDGVIEADLFKMSDKYIFRLGGSILYVYSIDKENSALVSTFGIGDAYGSDKGYFIEAQMYLSEDCKTVTVLKSSLAKDGWSNIVSIISIDVSDVNNISQKGEISIQGSLNTSRMVDGKLLLVTEYYFNRGDVDYNDPSTFVPNIDNGSGPRPIEFEDIVFPENIGNTRYSVVALVDTENLVLLGANALLNFTSNVYVSQENVYVTREYSEKKDVKNENSYVERDMSDIAVISYRGEALEKKGVITAEGRTKDQYSFDERNGYLRVVTSTRENIKDSKGSFANFESNQNVSLYVFSLADNSLAYSVENFAIEGEEATAVRFDGAKLYVCTAEVVTFTDPVYFFDLSDYENIRSTDTGIIEGFSTSLINLGEGFLLGIGEEDWQYNKVEVYEECDGQVVSVDEFKFGGNYARDYKAYLVNREENLFGFAVYRYDEYGHTETVERVYRYILLSFNGYELNVVCDVKLDGMYSCDTYRATYIDGYIYITSPEELFVEKAK